MPEFKDGESYDDWTPEKDMIKTMRLLNAMACGKQPRKANRPGRA